MIPTEPEHRAPAPGVFPFRMLALVCAAHAAFLGWAALVLPWKSGSWFTIAMGGLCVLHVVVALLALSRKQRLVENAWRALAVASLVLLFMLGIAIAGSALYLSELYRGIGRAIAAALFGIWGIFCLFTLPVAAWGLSRVGWPFSWRRRTVVAALAFVLAGVWVVLIASSAARARPVDAAKLEAAEQSLLEAVAERSAFFGSKAEPPRISLFQASPAVCSQAIDPAGLTLLVTYAAQSGKPETVCLQAPDPAELRKSFSRLLETRSLPRQLVKLDLVRATHPLWRFHPWIDALKIRPVRDGLCGRGRCFAPWQLVALEAFTQYRPLDSVGDARFGCVLDQLAELLGSKVPESEPLIRIETQSFLVRDRELIQLSDPAALTDSPSAQVLADAAERAEAHIIDAALDDGGFRYLVDPYRGELERQSDSLPRQAGTTLALCELSRQRGSRGAVRRALTYLQGFEQQSGPLSAISVSSSRARLGHSALPLVAFAACRSRVGGRHDVLIGRLARLLLAMQREDGSFAPEFLLSQGRASGTQTPLYAAGQAVLALVLVEQLSQSLPSPPFPSQTELGNALERAMHYYANQYWPALLRPLFFLEENWHCLAARAALASRRHKAYEQFCLDYVSFKARLILEPSQGVVPEHVGGYSISNMLPPHTTPSAGFAEALAAAIPIKRARGLDVAEDQARLQSVLQFIARQQWTVESCFACANPGLTLGGFSESSASPAIRIDYVQHALSALGHGLSALAPSRGLN